MKNLKISLLKVQAAVLTGVIFSSSSAFAVGNDFGSIARNVNESIEELPGLLTAVAYLMGLLMGTMGIIKLKDHVENPQQTAMKDGAIRLAAGGALFALPIIFESMLNTIGTTNYGVEAPQLNKAIFNVK